MTRYIITACLSLPFLAQAQQHPMLEKLWETDTIIAVPESVLPDAAGKTLFVSLIDGGPWEVDGKGGVGRLGVNGKGYDPGWITGLNAPKGLGRWENRLYVADISDVVVIDIQRGKIEKKIPVQGATGLNDVTVDKKGVVYVSDSKAGNVYKIEKDVPKLFMDGLAGANGVMASGDSLYILANKAVLIASADGKGGTRTITTLPNGGDGVEEAGRGDLIVSEWIGYIYYVYADGRKELLLDSHLEKKNTADIHYDRNSMTLYVPGFNARTVAAYKLKFGASGTTSDGPRVALMDAAQLALLKKNYLEKDPLALQQGEDIKKKADKYLGLSPVSVMFKQGIPPSGNKHDYMSQAPYFWYDSSKPNGLPYKSLDGQRNPEIYKITDRTYIGTLESATHALALAWYVTGEEKYAGKTTELLKRWFLEDSSRMNPNLEFAQSVPGLVDGRSYGIIETIALMGIADAAGLLEGSPSWTTASADSLRAWYGQYLSWMLTSKKGQEEHHAKNNHGVWYLAQAATFALYIGDKDKARALVEEGKNRVESQIGQDGKMPLELARTNSMHYSAYNLQAFFNLSKIGSLVGVDLWDYRSPTGAGIRAALDWLRPFAMGEKKWEYQEITPYNYKDFSTLLIQAGLAYREPQYINYAKTLDGEKIPHYPY
jgi:hypothetical protein